MRAALLVAVGVAVFGLLVGGCCGSLMCNAKKVATAEMNCADDLKVTNVSQQVDQALAGSERYLRVDGCGRQVQLRCEPTNAVQPVKRYREDVIPAQNRLDLKWRCQPAADLASR
jgi:hypothetical protein